MEDHVLSSFHDFKKFNVWRDHQPLVLAYAYHHCVMKQEQKPFRSEKSLFSLLNSWFFSSNNPVYSQIAVILPLIHVRIHGMKSYSEESVKIIKRQHNLVFKKYRNSTVSTKDLIEIHLKKILKQETLSIGNTIFLLSISLKKTEAFLPQLNRHQDDAGETSQHVQN